MSSLLIIDYLFISYDSRALSLTHSYPLTRTLSTRLCFYIFESSTREIWQSMPVSLFCLPNECIFQILLHNSLDADIQCSHTCRLLRQLVYEVRHPFYLYFLQYGNQHDLQPFTDPRIQVITKSQRVGYVFELEASLSRMIAESSQDMSGSDVLEPKIPEPYREFLLEWPCPYPPFGIHWPDALSFHFHSYCTCDYVDGECTCAEDRITNEKNITLSTSLLQKILGHEEFDHREAATDSRWELFANPPRLHTIEQKQETCRFIRLLKGWQKNWGSWSFHSMRMMLRIGSYSDYSMAPDRDADSEHDNGDAGRAVQGQMYMILEPPLTGEIHAWDDDGWYNGIIAKDFMEYLTVQTHKVFT